MYVWSPYFQGRTTKWAPENAFECFQNVVCKFVTDTEDEGEDSHSGAQPAGAVAVIDDADLGDGVLVPPPALACDTSEHNDGENLN